MQHIKILRILDFVLAGLLLLFMLGMLVSIVWGIALGASSGFDSDTLSALIPNLIGQGIVLVIVGAPLILAVLAGMRLPAGKGRIAQTLLALAVVLICPCGTLFAAYSLWVCWMNEESSKHLSGTSDVSD